jgi:hypothetical protein
MMMDIYKQLIQDEQDIDAKCLQGFLKDFKKPEILPSKIFKDKMKRRLTKKIQNRQEMQEQKILAEIPSFAKWRFRLSGFVTAVCSFLFLFVLSFFTDFFSNQLFIPSKYVEVKYFDIQEEIVEMNATMGGNGRMMALADVAFDRIEHVDTYAYNGRRYPRISAEMPVYKLLGTLMNE